MAKPYRNKKWLAFVRSLPCCVTGVRRRVEACHTGPHGLNQKAPDDMAIPLIKELHRTGNYALDKIGRLRFEEHFHISIEDVLALLNAKPIIRLDGDHYVADYLGETYTLVHRSWNLHGAIQRAMALRRNVIEDSLSKQKLRRAS